MTTATRPPAHSFTVLLARYISGGVESEQLDALCDLIETAEASASERLAFARYYLDTMGDEETALPQLQEWTDLMVAARA